MYCCGKVGVFTVKFMLIFSYSFAESLSRSMRTSSVYYKEAKISDSSVPCFEDEDCLDRYTPGIDYPLEFNSSLVSTPICIFPDDSVSSTSSRSWEEYSTGFCSCSPNCLSYSRTESEEKFYYCGPCGRVGSQCVNSTCSHSMAECRDDFCECKSQGTFYELYYCYVPYYGYEVALQMAIATCIIIAGCLIIVAVYNAIGFRRMRHLHNFRQLLRGEGSRQSLPEDTPPKYDDIVEDLPSYQEAVQMMKKNDKLSKKGVSNPTFEDDDMTPELVRRQDINVESFRSQNEILKSTKSSSPSSGRTNSLRSSSDASKDSIRISSEISAQPESQNRQIKVKGIRKDRDQPAKLNLEYYGQDSVNAEEIISSKHMKEDELSVENENTTSNN